MRVVQTLLAWALPVFGGYVGYAFATTDETDSPVGFFIAIGVFIGVALTGGIGYLVPRRSD